MHIFCHADRERVFHKNSVRATRDDRDDALVQKDRSHRLSLRFLMFDSCLLFVSPDSDLCVYRLCAGRGKLHIFCHADRERVLHKKSQLSQCT